MPDIPGPYSPEDHRLQALWDLISTLNGKIDTLNTQITALNAHMETMHSKQDDQKNSTDAVTAKLNAGINVSIV